MVAPGYFRLWLLKTAVATQFQFFLSGVMMVCPLVIRRKFVFPCRLLPFLFTTHAVPPQRAADNRTPSHLCMIAPAAIQALEPDCLSSGYSFFHVWTPVFMILLCFCTVFVPLFFSIFSLKIVVFLW